MAATADGSQGMRDRPVGDVVRDLSRDLSLLVRQELELARAEMAQKGMAAKPGLELLGAAGVLGLAAAGSLTAFLILVLAIALPAWAAALVVGLVLGVAAFALGRMGRERVSDAGPPVPEQTIETVKEDVEWAKTRARSARR